MAAVCQSGKMNVGLGAGIDYGGFGGRFTYLPAEKFGLFGALGYNMESVGFNGGILYKFIPEKKVTPTISAMYGYNGVIIVKGASEYNGTYYGPSLSAGVEWKVGNNPKNYWNLELIIPFRSQEFTDDWDAIKDNPDFDVQNDILPVAFSIGYHFGF